jgi:hypothetical protein
MCVVLIGRIRRVNADVCCALRVQNTGAHNSIKINKVPGNRLLRNGNTPGLQCVDHFPSQHA